MSLTRGIREVLGAARVKNEASAPLTLADPSGWPSQLHGAETVSETGSMKLSAVNRCVELISQSVGKLPIYCVNTTTRQRVRHDVLYLLNVRPNESMTPSVERQMVEANRLCGGAGYEWIIRDRHSGRPVELIPLPWELVQPWRDDRGQLWFGVVNPINGDPMVLHNQDVKRVMAYTHDGVHGQSVLSRASEVIRSGRATQQYELSYFQNGGAPSGTLETDADLNGKMTRTKSDGSTEEVSFRQVMREEWEKVHAGPSNSHRVAILDHGLKYKPITISNADAQMVESKDVTVSDIARFFGVPLSKLYAGKQAYNSNEQNAIDYVVSTLHPIAAQYDEENSYKLLPDYELRSGLWLGMNLLAELKGDTTSRGNWYKAMRDVGAFSADDIRELEDLPSIGKGGDIYYGNKNYAPLDQFREISASSVGAGK